LEEFQPEVVFVTNPTAKHLETALQAAQAGCHVLVEKPLSDQIEGLGQLAQALKEHKRFGFVAYPMRFHPHMLQVRSWLKGGTLGRPLYAHLVWAEHVPDWHPWENYAESYAVRKDLGGGAALTYSHDLDLCLWLFGQPETTVGWPNQSAPLAGDAEQGYDLLLKYGGGLTVHVHADYFTRPPIRRFELTATHGRVVFDYLAGTLVRYNGIVGERPPVAGPSPLVVEAFQVSAGFDRNDLFMDELRYFFDCLDCGTTPQPDIGAGSQAVQLALAARAQEIREFPRNPFTQSN
jgi:predicted dehydrogenase